MNFLQKVWSYKVKDAVLKQPKIRALRLLGWFMAAMISLTFISRMADSITLARVRVEGVRKSTIAHEVRAEGLVNARGGTPIIAPSGMLITQTAVQNGDRVAVGDLLFSYDLTELKEIIAGKQIALSALQAQLGVIRQQEEVTQGKVEVSTQRGTDKYATTKESYSLQLETLGEEIRVARINLRKYDGVKKDDYNDEDYSESEYNQLRANLRTLQLRYEQLELEQDNALTTVEQEMEDVLIKTPDASEQLKLLEIQQANLELSTLYGYAKDEGAVYASKDGLVAGITAETGKRTGNEAMGFITEETALEFEGEITEADKKFISVGDSVKLGVFGNKKPVENVMISKIEPIPGKPGRFRIVGEIGAGAVKMGDSATLVSTKSSRVYDSCVPLTSIYTEGNNNYVLILREEETVLGIETVVEKVDVTVGEKNSEQAAVSGSFPMNAKVIVYSDKPISASDRVRVESS